MIKNLAFLFMLIGMMSCTENTEVVNEEIQDLEISTRTDCTDNYAKIIDVSGVCPTPCDGVQGMNVTFQMADLNTTLQYVPYNNGQHTSACIEDVQYIKVTDGLATICIPCGSGFALANLGTGECQYWTSAC